jgi:hypothetical protein
LSGAIPALIQSKDGSLCGTSGELGSILWPLLAKNASHLARISAAFMGFMGEILL